MLTVRRGYKRGSYLILALSGLMLTICALPGLCSEWWPSRHLIADLHTKSFPEGAAPPVQVFCPGYQDWDYVLWWQNEEPKDGRPFRGHLYIEDDGRHLLQQTNFYSYIARAGGCEADGDSIAEIYVVTYDSSHVSIHFLNWPDLSKIGNYELKADNFEWRHNAIWDVQIMVGPYVHSTQLDSSGIILRVVEGWSLVPCGMVFFDPVAGVERWHRWTAAPTECIEHSLLSDGSSRVIYASDACSNGAVLYPREILDSLLGREALNGRSLIDPPDEEWDSRSIVAGTRDDDAYLMAFDIRGNELWRHEFTTVFTKLCAYSAVSPGQKSDEIISLVSAFASKEQPTLLQRIDARSGSVLDEIPVTHGGSRAVMHPLDGAFGGQRLFIVTAEATPFQVFDKDLNLISKSESIAAASSVLADANSDGVTDVPVQLPDGSCAIFDHTGKNLVRIADKGQIMCLQRVRDPDGSISKWTSSWVATNGKVTLYSVRENPYYIVQLLLASSGYLLGGTGLIWLVTWSIRTRRAYVRARREKLVLEGWSQVAAFQAHDTKKPIAVIQRALDNFEIRLQRKHPDVEAHQFFERMRGEISRMLQTARQIQVVSRATKPDFQEHDLDALIGDTVARMNELEQVPVQHDRSNTPLMLHCDFRLVESMLENLIGNAMDATTNGACVRVSASPANGGLPGVNISVSDNGSGMGEETIQSILEGKGSRKPGGQGLGILSAKWIAETHGGTLKIDSRIGLGTTITVFIPTKGGDSSHAKTSS